MLESRHTQMEVDSVYVAIEWAKKQHLYVSSQRDTYIRLARRRNSYFVIPLKYSDFLDFKNLSNGIHSCNLNYCNGQNAHGSGKVSERATQKGYIWLHMDKKSY